MTPRTDIEGQVGDSLTVRARVSDLVGNVTRARVLTGATLSARVRYGDSPLSDLAPDQLRATVDDATNGIVLVSLPSDHTLPAATFYYEVDLTQGDLNETILRGSLTIHPSLI